MGNLINRSRDPRGNDDNEDKLRSHVDRGNEELLCRNIFP